MFQNIKEWNKGFEDAGSVVLPFHAHLATKNNGFHWFASQFRAGLYNNKYYIHRQDILLSDIEKEGPSFLPFFSKNFCEIAVNHITEKIDKIENYTWLIVSIYGLFITPVKELELRYSIIIGNEN